MPFFEHQPGHHGGGGQPPGPGALDHGNRAGAQMRGPGLGHQRRSGVPFAAHAQPQHKAEEDQHGDGAGKAGAQRTQGISKDTQHQRPGAANAVGDQAEEDAPHARRQQHESIRQPGNGFIVRVAGKHVQRLHHLDLHVAVEQNVKAIQPPAQRRGQQRALLRGGGLGKSRERGGGHGALNLPWAAENSPRRRGDAEKSRKGLPRIYADQRGLKKFLPLCHFRK